MTQDFSGPFVPLQAQRERADRLLRDQPRSRLRSFLLVLLFRLHLPKLVLQLLNRRLCVLIRMVERGAVVYFLQTFCDRA
jgi:hypothetical protein